jgi:hypothetical protein
MRRIEFTEKNRSGNLLHIEVPGAIVNIRIGLHTNEGNEVTSIQVIADQYAGDYWRIADGAAHTRVVKDI